MYIFIVLLRIMINMDYSDDVYKPSDDTYLILDNAECGKSVLEMGSGYGKAILSTRPLGALAFNRQIWRIKYYCIYNHSTWILMTFP